jgi:hypothetical protein
METREREREREAERAKGALLLCLREVKKAEFSIAQYEFSPVCGMQESIYAFYYRFGRFDPSQSHRPLTIGIRF